MESFDEKIGVVLDESDALVSELMEDHGFTEEQLAELFYPNLVTMLDLLKSKLEELKNGQGD